MKNNKDLILPTTSQLEKLLSKEIYKSKYKNILKSIINTIIIVISISILATTFLFSCLHIQGDSMNPNLNNGDFVISIKDNNIEKGDIIAFYYNNKILIKRVIATSQEWVDIDKEGNVYINNKLLKEPYIDKKAYGEVDINFPYQVKEDSYFVLGDNRDTSIDSRNSLIKTISKEDIIGKVIFRIWPIKRIGIIN